MKLQQRVHILLAPPLLIFIFLFIKIENGRFHPGLVEFNILNHIRIVNTSVSIVLILTSIIYFLLKTRKITGFSGLRVKLDEYFKASMIRNYLLEVCLITNLISMGLTGEKLYIGIFSISLILFLLGYPAMWRIINFLKPDQKNLENIVRMGPIE